MNPATIPRSWSPTCRQPPTFGSGTRTRACRQCAPCRRRTDRYAAEFGAGKLEVLPDHPQQRRGRRRITRRRLAVHSEVDGHACPPSLREWRMAPIVLRYSLFATRYSTLELTQRRFDARRIERQVADAFAGCIGEGVDDGGDRRPLRAFACAERTLIRTVDQLDLDLRRFRHGEDRIAGPVARQNPAPIETHLLLQRPAHRLDDAAFDLAGEPIGIDDQAGID